MNRTDYDKQRVLQQIDAHRKLMTLELRELSSKLSPLARLSTLGKLGQFGGAWLGPLATLGRTVGARGAGKWRFWLRVAAAAHLAYPLVEPIFKRRREARQSGSNPQSSSD